MFKQFLKIVEGADLYMVASFLIFLIFFIAVLIWLVKADKGYLERSKRVPFNDGENFNNN